jgi:hypothetical protein
MDTKLLIGKVQETVDGLLKDYQSEISQAYLKCDEDKALNIGLSVKLKPDKKSKGVVIEANISLVTERIKDKATCIFNPDQPDLKFPESKNAKRKN